MYFLEMAPKWSVWVPRPPDKCTGGEMGPRKRFPLLPGQKSTKKCPQTAKIQKLWPLQNLCLPLKGSDYGLLKKCQNEKMQFFMANRFPLLPGRKNAKNAKNAKIQKIGSDLLLGAI